MFRVLFILAAIIAAVFGLGWLIDRPGEITLSWQGYRVETSLLISVGALLALVAALIVAWNLVIFLFRAPTTLSMGQRARRREKGYSALSRGIIAVGVGDAKLAARAAAEAERLLPDEPLALLLRAEAAQLAGDHHAVEAAFREMTRRDDTRLLGFRGLHAQAHRRGDIATAHHLAATAHGIAALPWTATSVLEKHVAAKDWEGALAALNESGSVISKPARERQRAVLQTAIALDKELSEPEEALRLARSALKRAPDLVPAAAVAARLFARKGAARRAVKLIEATWPLAPHPDLARIYLDLRPNDSNADRLARARALAKLAPGDSESAMTVAAAAIGACEYVVARDTMLPLIQREGRASARMCLLMAEIEEAEHGDAGYAREWLARASRAPRDACWIADGVLSEQWLPASPVTGKLDAFVWKRPDERRTAKAEVEEAIFRPVTAAAKAETLLIEKAPAIAIAPPAPASPSAVPEQEATRPGSSSEARGLKDQSAEVDTSGGGQIPPRERPDPEGMRQPS